MLKVIVFYIEKINYISSLELIPGLFLPQLVCSSALTALTIFEGREKLFLNTIISIYFGFIKSM